MGIDPLIWWTNQSDAQRVAKLLDAEIIRLPKYIKSEFMSRLGRNGRGRLWVPALPETEGLEEIPWDDAKVLCQIAHEAAGIVFLEKDASFLATLPGFITTLEMELWQPTSLILNGAMAQLRDSLSRGPGEPPERFAARLVARVVADLGALLEAVQWHAKPSWWLLAEYATRDMKEKVEADNSELPIWQMVTSLRVPVLRLALRILATDLAFIASQEWSDE